jgi:hypothetical protein
MWRTWQLFKKLQQLIIATLCLCQPSRIHSAINELFQRQLLSFVWLDSCVVNSSSISFGSIQNCRVWCVQIVGQCLVLMDEWIKTVLCLDPGLPRLQLHKTNRTVCSNVCKSGSDASPCRILKTKEWWRKENLLKARMCLCYILSQCLPAFTIFSLLAVLGRFTLPLKLFPYGEFCNVRAYCIVLQFGLNVTYYFTQESSAQTCVRFGLLSWFCSHIGSRYN